MSLPDPDRRDDATNTPLKTVELGKITVFNYPIDSNIFAAICNLPLFPFILIPCLIGLNTASDSPQFIRFNAIQSLIINFAFVVLSTVLGFLSAIPVLGAIFWLVQVLVILAYIGVSLKLVVGAFLGQRNELPVISDYARQYSR